MLFRNKKPSNIYFTLNPITLEASIDTIKPKSLWEVQWRPKCFLSTIHFTLGEHVTGIHLFNRSKRVLNDESRFDLIEERRKSPDLFNNLSIIKSLLQKAIRRQDLDISLSAAKTFMLINLKSFLRRLIIICVEDVIPDSNTILTLIWMFKASCNEFPFTLRHYNYLLGVISMLVHETRCLEVEFADNLQPMNVHLPLSVALHTFINSTTFYLHNDKKMLSWYHNNIPNMTFMSPKLKPKNFSCDMSQVETITTNTCPTYAVDFHTNPCMLQNLSKGVFWETKEKLSADRIKALIWNFRSGVNYRRPTPPFCLESKNKTSWEKIELRVETYSKNMLSLLEKINAAK